MFRLLLCFVPLLLLTASGYCSDLEQRARAILSNRCFACHGPDEEQRQSGLRLDTPEGLLAEADSGVAAIVPGNPKESELLRRVRSPDDFERMPPPEFSGPLSDEESSILTQWIEQGANLPVHWSFVSPQRPALPQPEDFPSANTSLEQSELANWLEHPIDRFVLARLLDQELKPSPEATRQELLRRLYLDLIGLPPTPQDVADFLADASPSAYGQQVDKLLASPAFGEHWARKWLDLARYADSAGYADDPPRTIWGYRDWVIDALNTDLPLPEFTVKQLAADMLPNPTPEQLVATAFHRNTLTNNEGGTNNEEFRNVAVVDRVNTTMAVWMGVTMACAQCHTHKYDPFTQKEYFQLFAIFNQSEDADLRNESPTIPMYSIAQKLERERLQGELATIDSRLAHVSPTIVKEFEKWDSEFRAPSWEECEIESNAGSKQVTLRHSVNVDTQSIQALKLVAANALASRESNVDLAGVELKDATFELTFTPQDEKVVAAKFVRIELPGKEKFLSLAEVEVISRGDNVATLGTAKQSSTDYNGSADRAIDGNTNGDYNKNSTTHTKRSEAPWWELELKQTTPVERVSVWNRSDGNIHNRLDGAKVILLDEARNEVFAHTLSKAEKTENAVSVSDVRPINLNKLMRLSKSAWVLVPKEPIQVSEPGNLHLRILHPSNAGMENANLTLKKTHDPSIHQWSLLTPELRQIQAKSRPRKEAEANKLRQFFARHLSALNADLRTEHSRLATKLASMKPETTVPIMRDRKTPRETAVQIRGNYKITGEKVSPGTPAVFHSIDSKSPSRLDLANWLVDRRNPLTARVWVNRMWESLFGAGIVRTSEEFGSQGDRPTHPELLDWLAVEFMDSGWNFKQMLRTLVMSRTYRQTSQASPTALAQDKNNVWLARGPRVRLSAEMVRDQSLAVAGLLTSKMYGAPVRPPQPDLGLKAAFGSATDWKTSRGEDRYRRGIYTTWRRSSPYPSMVAFDAPSREVCTLKRDSTNTPLQALVTLNDPAYVEAAQGLARRVALQDLGPQRQASKHEDRSVAQQIAHAFELCTGRLPSESEAEALESLYRKSKLQLADTPEAALTLATDPLGPLPSHANAVEMAALTTVCNVLLNLDEVLMKR